VHFANNVQYLHVLELLVDGVADAAAKAAMMNSSDADDVKLSVLDDCCPVCGDRVSGYHYGLQTCESCKGQLPIQSVVLIAHVDVMISHEYLCRK